jgi:hypothetical protein
MRAEFEQPGVGRQGVGAAHLPGLEWGHRLVGEREDFRVVENPLELVELIGRVGEVEVQVLLHRRVGACQVEGVRVPDDDALDRQHAVDAVRELEILPGLLGAGELRRHVAVEADVGRAPTNAGERLLGRRPAGAAGIAAVVARGGRDTHDRRIAGQARVRTALAGPRPEARIAPRIGAAVHVDDAVVRLRILRQQPAVVPEASFPGAAQVGRARGKILRRNLPRVVEVGC